jgi:hypothetical protein
MLNSVDGCLSYHEPDRDLNRAGSIRALNIGIPAPAEKWWEVKLERLHERKENCDVYVETFFHFIFYWADFAVRDIRDIKIIDIYRDLGKVLRSFYRSRHFTEKITTTPEMPDPDWHTNLTRPRENPTSLDIGLWYIFEIEARKEKFKNDYPEIPIFRFDLGNKSVEDYENLLSFLGLEFNDKLRRLIDMDPVLNSYEKGRPGRRGEGRILIHKDFTVEDAQEAVRDYKVLYR